MLARNAFPGRRSHTGSLVEHSFLPEPQHNIEIALRWRLELKQCEESSETGGRAEIASAEAINNSSLTEGWPPYLAPEL